MSSTSKLATNISPMNVFNENILTRTSLVIMFDYPNCVQKLRFSTEFDWKNCLGVRVFPYALSWHSRKSRHLLYSFICTISWVLFIVLKIGSDQLIWFVQSGTNYLPDPVLIKKLNCIFNKVNSSWIGWFLIWLMNPIALSIKSTPVEPVDSLSDRWTQLNMKKNWMI